MVGPTFKAILTKQFAALRDGDSYWWRNQGFDSQTYQQIQNTTLADIIERNTNTKVVPQDVFQAVSRTCRSILPAFLLGVDLPTDWG